MNGGCKRAQRLVGANVGGGLLAANVLFARGQRQHKTAAPVAVGRLPRKAARHLPDKFFSRGDDANIGPAVAWSKTKALAFQRNDVRFCRRLDQSQRNAL